MKLNCYSYPPSLLITLAKRYRASQVYFFLHVCIVAMHYIIQCCSNGFEYGLQHMGSLQHQVHFFVGMLEKCWVVFNCPRNSSLCLVCGLAQRREIGKERRRKGKGRRANVMMLSKFIAFVWPLLNAAINHVRYLLVCLSMIKEMQREF